MNTFFAVAVSSVMLVMVGRILFGLIKMAKGLDARNRRLALLTFTLIMVGSVATFIIVHSVRVANSQ
jgi:hypothetical protein